MGDVAVERATQASNGLKSLAARLTDFEQHLKSTGEGLAEPLSESLKEVQAQLSVVETETQELSSYTELALGQAEKLKKENAELRKAKEDAVVEGQLGQKKFETEKLATASTAYKKDLLQKTLVKRENEVQVAKDKLQAAERQIKSLTSQLSDLRRSHRETTTELEDLKEKSSANAASQTEGLPEPSKAASSAKDNETATTPATGQKQGLGNEHEILAARLLDGGLEKLDSATIAAAAAGLRDTSVLEKQLKRARDENERLQKEIQQLNDTVFSKSFKAPSAWAEREVKYKMEKRAWEQQVASLKEQMRSLQEENRKYREVNRAAEFEDQIKDLKAAVRKAEAEKTAAQQAVHELQLQMREVSAIKSSASRRTDLAPDDAKVHDLISAMEEHGIGVQQPRTQLLKSDHKRSSATGMVRTGSSPNLDSFPAIGANLQELIEEYDDQGIGIAGPFAKRKSFKSKPEAFTGVADAVPEGSTDNVYVDLESIKDGLRSEIVRSKGQGSDSESEASHSRRRTWSTELPDGSFSMPPPPHMGEPSRLQNVTRSEDPPVAATHETPTKKRHAGKKTTPSDTTSRVMTADASTRPGAVLFSDAAEVSSSRADTAETSRHSAVGSPAPSSAALDLPDITSTAPTHQRGDTQAATQQPSASNQQAQASEAVAAKSRADDSEEVAAADGSVSARVDAHGDDPSLPASQGVQRDWVTQGRLGDGETETAAHSDRGNLVSATDTSAAAAAGDDSDAAAGGQGQQPGSVAGSEQTARLHTASSTPRGGSLPSVAGHLVAPGAQQRVSVQSPPPGIKILPSSSTASAAAADDCGAPPAEKASGSHAERQTGPQESARSGRRAPLREGASALAEIEPLSEGGVADARSLQRVRVLSGEPDAPGKGRSLFLSRNSSDSDSPWTKEKLNALAAEKSSLDAEWREHVVEQDIGTLRYKAAELESRVEMHEAQIAKMSRALERADQEKARLEEDLELAMRAALGGKLLDSNDQQSLNALRERMCDMVGPDHVPNAKRLKETEGALQQAYREVQGLERQRDELQKQLASIAKKIDSGVIPAPKELELPESMKETNEAGEAEGPAADRGNISMSLAFGDQAAKRSRQFKNFIGGFEDEEIEVMGLRQENETMMDTLVRTKVELAETQGDYLKMRRALIRAVEKQAALADRLESLSTAYGDGNMDAVDELIKGIFEPPQAHRGDIESLGERERF